MPAVDRCEQCGAPAQAAWRACPYCGVAFKRGDAGDDPVRVLANYIGALRLEKPLHEALVLATRGYLKSLDIEDDALVAEIARAAAATEVDDPMELASFVIARAPSRGIG